MSPLGLLISLPNLLGSPSTALAYGTAAEGGIVFASRCALGHATERPGVRTFRSLDLPAGVPPETTLLDVARPRSLRYPLRGNVSRLFIVDGLLLACSKNGGRRSPPKPIASQRTRGRVSQVKLGKIPHPARRVMSIRDSFWCMRYTVTP